MEERKMGTTADDAGDSSGELSRPGGPRHKMAGRVTYARGTLARVSPCRVRDEIEM